MSTDYEAIGKGLVELGMTNYPSLSEVVEALENPCVSAQ